MEYKIVGCGISGAVIARELAEHGNKVTIYDRRNHIAGNMYDYKDEYGYLVQLYGPHIFHTSDEKVIKYVKKYAEWDDFKLVCGASWDGKYTVTPFNFDTIDVFYSREQADVIKQHIRTAYPNQKTATVVELLNHEDEVIRKFAEFLFENDYAPYTAKQWGLDPKDVDPSVLKRVPIRLNYDKGYFSDVFEAMPKISYTDFISNILNHENININLCIEAMEYISLKNDEIYWDGKKFDGKLIYTGPLDELFSCYYGNLPYRSLKFEWKHSEKNCIQNAPVVAYPKEEGYTRITEFNKLPKQNGKGTSYAIEYPLPYKEGEKMEPYYPVLTKDSENTYLKYQKLANKFDDLILCGRLAEFKYFNMDQAIKNALCIVENILE